MSKPTPGPWEVDKTVALGAYGVWTAYATHPGHDGSGFASQICSVMIPGNEIPTEQKNANARLIAAAPDLLAACQAALAVFTGHEYGGAPGTTDAIAVCRAAIAKATVPQPTPAGKEQG